MPTTDLTATSFVSSTGWTGAVSTIQSSNDTRLTDGTVDELFEIELTDTSPTTVGLSNTMTVSIEARTLGTATRAKTLFVEIFDHTATQVATYTTPVLTTTDVTHTSSALTVADYTASQVTDFTLRATVQEGGGMADTATVEVDYVLVVLDHDVPGQDLTAPYYNPNDDSLFAPTVTSVYNMTAPFYNPLDDINAYTPIILSREEFLTVDNIYTNVNTIFTPAQVNMTITQGTIINTGNTIPVPTVTTSYDMSQDAVFTNTQGYFTHSIANQETTRRIIFS